MTLATALRQRHWAQSSPSPGCHHELPLGGFGPDLGVDVHGEEGAGAVEHGSQGGHEGRPQRGQHQAPGTWKRGNVSWASGSVRAGRGVGSSGACPGTAFSPQDRHVLLGVKFHRGDEVVTLVLALCETRSRLDIIMELISPEGYLNLNIS